MRKFNALFLIMIVESLLLSACHSQDTANIQVNVDDCVQKPSLKSGFQHQKIYNTTSQGLDLSLSSAEDGKVFAEIEQFGSETTRILDYGINPGNYQFNCYFDQLKPVYSTVFAVTGQTIPTPYPAISPVSLLDITPAIRHYEAWIMAQMPATLQDAQNLQHLIVQRNISAARQAWEKLHDIYETLGGAYQAFGDYDTKIDGSSAGLPGGVHDENFTGIHAVEFYSYASPIISDDHWRKLDTLSKNLVLDISDLQQALPNIHIDPIDMGIRAHEILENTIQFTLSGRDDYGSHTTLDTVYANLQGTQRVIYFMHPVLDKRYAGLDLLEKKIGSTLQEVQDMRSTTAAIPITQWPVPTREKLDSLISSLTEKLADIAAITDIRRH